jgi:hypothetical protein
MSDDAREALADAAELLYRQVHPSFVRDGRPSSQAFRPTPKDENKVSVSRATLTTAEAAHRHFTEMLGLASAGTWGVTVEECTQQALPVWTDPVIAPPAAVADPAHAVIDFEGISKSQAEAKATRLTRLAVARGRLHPPEQPS